MTASISADAIEAGFRPSRPRGPFVLFAAPLVSESTEAFKRAQELVRSVAGEVTFLRVSSPSFNAFARTTIMAGRPVLNRSGDFLSVVAETAKVLKPAVIAIPELSGHTGRSVRGFALECGVPVLVAREELESKVILAASDLAHPSFPVLRAAALLSASHRVRVVFLHNLCPTPSDGARTSASLERCLPSVLDRLEDLTLAANAFNIESDNVVTTGPDVDESLMSVIQRERPDIVIIGARDRRQPHSTKAPLAQTVYDETAPSVVVVPLDHLRASHAPLPDHGSS